VTAYFDELCRAMERVAERPDAVFIGQAVRCSGTAMSRTFANVPMEKRIEFPVAEDFQLGAALGMSLRGLLPVCIYPRINFLLLAMSQLALHLDKIPIYSRGGYKPKVIIRTAVATDKPLDPGVQHLGSFVDAFKLMLEDVEVFELHTSSEVRMQYQDALDREGSTLLVERAELYA
jgi:pyruvate/2-oxoglutarate/acetoin dehydrogenase E1 component